MKKNKITLELIEDRLNANGFGEDVEENDEKMMLKVLDHYDIELTDQWEEGLEYYMYAESTQDGYEIFIATHNPNKICINDDVYYYDHDLADALSEGIRYANGYGKIYIADLDDSHVDEAMRSLYEGIYDTAVENVTNELIDEGYEE